MTTPNDTAKYEKTLFSTFLESIPPGEKRTISGLLKHYARPSSTSQEVLTPAIQLHCPDPTCDGVRVFKEEESGNQFLSKNRMGGDFFFTYTCCNCSKFQKTYSVRIGRVGGSASAVKFGEIPSFGPPLSPRLISLIGPDYDLFMKGWRAERQGLGIGSFSYYRRVVENQKGRIIAEIRKAAESLRASDEFLKRLDRAKEETQFSEAIDLVKNAIPDRIKIRGHNPLTLLHRPLSAALHNLNDEQCLKQANAIRLVLAELASKIARVKAEDKELRSAVSTLLSSD